MRGRFRKISVPRRLIADLMHASMSVPFVSLRRTLELRPLLDARDQAIQKPGLAAIFAKAFCLVAQDEPVLRTLYIKWPWPHFYELPRSVGMVAIARIEDREECVLLQKVLGADKASLAEVDAIIRHAKTADAADVPAFRTILRATRLPLPVRRLLWFVGLNIGRQRANYFGSFAITSVSAVGAGELHAISPGPFILSYGTIGPDQTIDLTIRWDHRVTDAALIAMAMTRLEHTLNGTIAAELLSHTLVLAPKAVRAVAG